MLHAATGCGDPEQVSRETDIYQAMHCDDAAGLSTAIWIAPGAEFSAGGLELSMEEQKSEVEGPPRQPFLVVQPTEHLSVAFAEEAMPSSDPGNSSAEAHVLRRHKSEASPWGTLRPAALGIEAGRELPWPLAPV